jgi:hypothetical protein
LVQVVLAVRQLITQLDQLEALQVLSEEQPFLQLEVEAVQVAQILVTLAALAVVGGILLALLEVQALLGKETLALAVLLAAMDGNLVVGVVLALRVLQRFTLVVEFLAIQVMVEQALHLQFRVLNNFTLEVEVEEAILCMHSLV